MKLKILYFLRSKILLFPCFLILIIACEKDTALDKYYNQKGNFGGSVYDALDSTGLHNYFVRSVDSTYYGNQLKNTLITVIAPSDEAFKAYFDKHGYNDLSSVPEKELQQLIGHHILNWPQRPDVFNDNPFIFKRQTNMAQDTVVKYDIKTGTNITVVQERKFLQFYTQGVLSFYGGTADDYKILTGSELSPSTGFNIYDVPVDSIVPYGNGWIYYVDKVVEPYQNLDDWLMDSDYSLFNFMFNRFSFYETEGPDETYYENVPITTLIKRNIINSNDNRHYGVDMELCFETVSALKQIGDFKIYPKAGSNFTVVAPENEALESFIENTFSDYPGFRETVNNLDDGVLENLHVKLIIKQIINPYLFLKQPVFPSNFYAGNVIASDKTSLKFSPQDIIETILCSNGYGYGVKTFVTPRTFTSILKPIYTTPNYKCITAAFDRVKLISYLNDINADFTLLLPTDEAFLKNGILLKTADEFNAGYGSITNTKGQNDYIFYDSTATPAAALTDRELMDLILCHLFIEPITPSSQKQYAFSAQGYYNGITVDSAWSGGNFVGYEGDRTIIPNIVKNITDLDNGKVYVIDELIQPPKFTIGELLSEVPSYSRFRDLCEDAGLLAGGNLEVYGFLPTLFVPANTAIDQYIADGKLPTDETELQQFIKYFFVNRTIFTSETINENVETLCLDEQMTTEFEFVYKKVELNGTYENLKIKGLNNASYLNVIEGSESNFICTDGIVHQIDGVLN